MIGCERNKLDVPSMDFVFFCTIKDSELEVVARDENELGIMGNFAFSTIKKCQKLAK